MDRLPIHALDPTGADATNDTPRYNPATDRLEFTPAGAGGAVAVDDEGVEIVASASRLNFAGAGVTVTDAGAGEATVTIPGGGSSGGGGSASYEGRLWPIDKLPATPSAMDDEFDGTTVSSLWTPERGTTAAPTVTVADGLMSFDAAPEAGWKIQGLTQPLPASGDWSFVLAVAACESPIADFVQPALLALAAGASGAAGAVQLIGFARFATTPAQRLEVGYGTTWATYNSTLIRSNNGADGEGYLRVSKAGTTYTWSYSCTGRKWWTLSSGTLPFTPGRVVIGAKSENASTGPLGLFKWFRRTA